MAKAADMLKDIKFYNGPREDIEDTYKAMMKEFYNEFRKICKVGTVKLVDSLIGCALVKNDVKNLHIVVTVPNCNDETTNNICLAFEEAAKKIGFEKADFGSATHNKKYPKFNLTCVTDYEEKRTVIFCPYYTKNK